MQNIIDAIIPTKKENKEKASVDMEFFFCLYFDGLSGAGTQQMIKDAFRKGMNVSSSFSQTNTNLVYSISENPQAKKPANKDIENDLIKHYAINVTLTPYNAVKNQYINQIMRTKQLIEAEVGAYIVKSEVESIKIYFYLVGYNQGEFIANIVNSIGVYDDDDKLKELLESYFDIKNFLSNEKIKTKIVESVTTFEPVGFIDSFVNNGLVKLITGRSDLLYKKDEDIRSSLDFPSEENISIYDAVLMCQHTYNSQDAADKSVFSIIHSWFSKSKKIASDDGEKVRIRVEEDIYENVRNNKHSTNKDEIISNDNWITTDAEWQSVSKRRDSKKYEDVIKNSGIDLSCRLTGFYSKLYERIEKGKTRSFAYCTAGTDPFSFNDWFFANFLQGLTGISFQYTQSVRNAKKLDKYCKDRKLPLYFVGHSLGGGLASNNALATSSRHAITFNAAGLNPLRIMATLLINNPKDYFNRTGRKNRVHPFIIDGEVVQLLRFIGQPAMSSEEGREKRYTGDIEMVNAKIQKKKGDLTPQLGDMGMIEKHNVLNFLRIKDLGELRIVL